MILFCLFGLLPILIGEHKSTTWNIIPQEACCESSRHIGAVASPLAYRISMLRTILFQETAVSGPIATEIKGHLQLNNTAESTLTVS